MSTFTADVGAIALAPEAGTAAGLLQKASSNPSLRARLEPLPTGFDPLDGVLDGGLRVGDLLLLGGRPGVGKTVAALQWARNVARNGDRAIFVCYEHGSDTLLTRLIMAELGELVTSDDLARVDRLRLAVRDLAGGATTPDQLAGIDPMLAEAHARVQEYAERLWLVRGSATGTGLQELDALVGELASSRTAIFVDYLQKVAVRPRAVDEAERVTRVADGLKELALSRGVAVVAPVAADRAGLTARRMRMHNLRGSAALAHEADVVITLNEKFLAVSKVHLAYHAARAATFHQYVVFSVEKNREGPSDANLEFRKDFPCYRFETHGRVVAEQHVHDVLYEE
jgi:replicative DNA helicase